MGNNDQQDLTKELAQIAEYRASLKWILLKERYPESSAHVLVRLAGNRIEGGEWHADTGTWTHSPFVTWGEPVAWAAFSPLHKAVGSTAVPPPVGIS